LSLILVIDDELNLCKIVRANLSARGYRVLVADKGKTGLKLAAQERPDLILLDLRIPGMSGWDVLMALKTNRILKTIPVIIMTAAMPEDEEYKIRRMRTAGILPKPFSIEGLLRQVAQVLEK
jgi:two-component system alkaline phosphatase synthesis response regulator PhoP